MIAHSFNRFYVFILSTASDINFSKFNFKNNCDYLKKRSKGYNHRIEKWILDLIKLL